MVFRVPPELEPPDDELLLLLLEPLEVPPDELDDTPQAWLASAVQMPAVPVPVETQRESGKQLGPRTVSHAAPSAAAARQVPVPASGNARWQKPELPHTVSTPPKFPHSAEAAAKARAVHTPPSPTFSQL
jgi:hypothetical protein